MIRLFWFGKADGSDTVSAVVQTDDPFFGTRNSNEIFLSDAALLARATAAGKDTWDEADLCAALSAEMNGADVHRAKAVEDAEAAAAAPPDPAPPQ